MSTENKKYGTLFGELKSYKDIEDIYSGDFNDALFKSLEESSVEEIVFDLEEGNDFVDTMFVTINEKTDLKKLMITLVKLRPHEFDEVSENTFRIWFD